MNQNPWGSLFKTIAILRIGTGVLLLTQHGWAAAIGAYQFLWKEEAWDWVKFFGEQSLPQPTLLAPAVAILVAGVAVSWTLGFLTRFFATLFLPVAVGGVILAQRLDSPMVETAWLYVLISFTLILFGSGAVSIDGLFRFGEYWSNRSKRKKRW